MGAGFNDVFLMLEDLNVMDSLLPFLLIFTILYAILNKTKIIGEGRKNFNVMVALILSLMVVIPHITGKNKGILLTEPPFELIPYLFAIINNQ